MSIWFTEKMDLKAYLRQWEQTSSQNEEVNLGYSVNIVELKDDTSHDIMWRKYKMYWCKNDIRLWVNYPCMHRNYSSVGVIFQENVLLTNGNMWVTEIFFFFWKSMEQIISINGKRKLNLLWSCLKTTATLISCRDWSCSVKGEE